MREIDVEFMRRHIGTFRHETHVAERAGVDDRLEILALHRVEFAALGAVDQVEQPRKTIAEVEAAAAGVTNVEHAPHLGVEIGFVVKVGALPIDRMPRRGVQTAFPHLKSMFPYDERPSRRGSLLPPRGKREKRLTSVRRASAGSGPHASARPWPESRTTRRFPRSLPRARNAPCPDTCPYIHGSRRRRRP